MILKKDKAKPVVEESLFLRMLWLAQTFTCFYLVGLVDSSISYVSFFDLRIPLLFIHFWTAVCGCYLSYHFRHQSVKWLEYVGLVTIAITCNWFIDIMRTQMNTYSGTGVDLLLPTVHLFAGLYVSHSFELRSRFDFNFSQGVSLLLVCFTATLGRGGWFGLGLLVYLVLAAALLLLDCESRTFGQVQARKIDGIDSYTSIRGPASSEKTANLIFPTLVLLCLSVSLFLLIPRAESFADMIASQVYALGRREANSSNISRALSESNKRLRNPFHVKPAWEKNEPAGKQETTEQKDEKNSQDNKSDAKGSDKTDSKSADKSDLRSSDKTEPNSSEKAPSAASGKGDAKKTDISKDKKTDRTDKTEGKGANFSRQEKKQQKEQEEREAELNRARSFNSPSDKDSSSPAQSTPPASDSSSKGSTHPEPNKNPSADSQYEPTSEPQAVGTGGQSGGRNKSAGKEPPAGGAKGDEAKGGKGSKKSGGAGNSKTEKSDKPEKQEKAPDPRNKNRAATKKDKNPVYYMPDTMDIDTPTAGGDELLFRVACNRTVPLRQGAFDYFDGNNWHVSDDLPKVEFHKVNGSYTFTNVFPIALQSTVPSIKLKQTYHMLKNMGGKIIVAGFPSYVEYPCSSITVDSAGNLKGSGFLIQGLDYTVISDEALYDIKEMMDEPVPAEDAEKRIRSGMPKFLQIPEDQSERLYELSTQIAGLEDNWFVQAEHISQYLRKNYTYGLEQKNNKSTRNSVDYFLFNSKKGDCKQFASSFVLLCRASGIPARMVVGFTPGDFNPATGARDVRLKNSHAWGEVYIPDAGWIPFDSTPVSNMPARQGEEERYFSTIGQKLSATGGQGGGTGNSIQIALGGSKTVTITLMDLLKLLPCGLLLVVIPGPFMMFMQDLRKINWMRPMHPAGKIYTGVQKDLRKIGVRAVDSETPGEFLQNVQRVISEWEDRDRSDLISNAVEDFVNTYNAAYFGAQGNIKDLEKKRKQIKVLIKR